MNYFAYQANFCILRYNPYLCVIITSFIMITNYKTRFIMNFRLTCHRMVSFAVLSVAVCSGQSAQTAPVDDIDQEWGKWTAWGEQEDGTYLNPILPSDYSDIDCIKVGDKYYAITSTFQLSPGVTVMRSTDLVNWELLTNVVDLTEISPALNWDVMDRYARGVWAGSIRYHDGRFYIFFGTPDEGFFSTSAPSAEGPWEPLTCLLEGPGWDDCSAIWDDEGNAWFVGTRFADNYKTYLWPMATDGKSIEEDKGMLVNEGDWREANKLIKVGDWYYLVFSEHIEGTGRYVVARRTRDMKEGFTAAEERQLNHADYPLHEPNQGGIIEGEPGKWYFFTHHGRGDWGGRLGTLLPVTWVDGWPLIGKIGDDGTGSMQWRVEMPHLPKSKSDYTASEQFGSPVLKPHFQWNYQPRKDFYSLTERKGWLRLKAFRPIEKGNLLKAGNTLAYRTIQYAGSAEIKLDLSAMTDGLIAGLCHFSQDNSYLGVRMENGKKYIEFKTADAEALTGPEITKKQIWLRSTWDADGVSRYSYSLDGKQFVPFGSGYQLKWGNYRGDRVGVFCFNDDSDTGYVDVDFFKNTEY